MRSCLLCEKNTDGVFMNRRVVFRLAHDLQSKYGEFDKLPQDKIIECCAILDVLKQYSIFWAMEHKLPKEQWRQTHDAIDVVLDFIFDLFD